MSQFWSREFIKLCLFGLLALIIWLAEGIIPALIFAVVILLIGNAFHLKNLCHLTRWLSRGDSRVDSGPVRAILRFQINEWDVHGKRVER